MNVETLESFDRCHRLASWNRQYINLRISPVRALYAALEAGLTGEGEKAAENKLMELAAEPGLDIEAADVYALAKHYAQLAATLTTYLRGDMSWVKSAPVQHWTSETYESGEVIRRVVLIDRWNEQRKMSEIRSWRTVAETSMLNRPMLINFITIGDVREGRRISPWTRTLAHPKNRQIRFQKKSHKAEGFADTWLPVWREHWEGSTLDWLGHMQADDVFTVLVHSFRVPVSPRRDEFVRDIQRIDREMAAMPANPPMTRSACYGFSPCKFVEVCHAPKSLTPAECGWVSVSDLRKVMEPGAGVAPATIGLQDRRSTV